jgi:hypothetical protein
MSWNLFRTWVKSEQQKVIAAVGLWFDEAGVTVHITTQAGKSIFAAEESFLNFAWGHLTQNPLINAQTLKPEFLLQLTWLIS